MYQADLFMDDLMYSDAAAVLMPLAVFYGAVLLGVLLFWIINYVFRGIGMYHLAKKQGLPSPFLAWIPYARVYLNGQLAGDIPLGKKWLRKPGLWLLFLPIACSVVGFASVIYYFVSLATASVPLMEMGDTPAVIGGFLTTLATQIVLLVVISVLISAAKSWITAIVHFAIYKKYRPDTVALTHAVLGLLIPLYTSIYLFILGQKAPVSYAPQPIMPQPITQQPAQDMPILPQDDDAGTGE